MLVKCDNDLYFILSCILYKACITETVMDDLSNFFKNLLQNVKRFLLQIKNRIPNLRWQLQNNKPLAFLCIAVLGILLFSSLKGLIKSPASADRKQLKVEVHTKVLATEPMYKTVTLFGQTNAAAKIVVVNKYAGMITDVQKDLGDKDINIQVNRAEADYKSYDAYTERYDATFNSNYQKYISEYNLKKTNFDRYTELFKKGAVSKLALDEAEQQMLSAKANLDSLTSQKLYEGKPAYVAERAQRAEQRRNSMLLLENQREDMTIRAPRDGVITYRNAEAGSYAQAGSHLFTIVDNSSLHLDCQVSEYDAQAGSHLFTIVDNSSLHLDCQVSEYDAALLKTGESVSVLVESLGKKYPGKITFVSPDKSKETKNYLVRVALDKADGQLKSGMFAKGSLRFLQKDNALFINRSAVLELNGKQYAFVLGEDKKAHRKIIQPGIRNTEELEIVSGLKAGDKVITDNVSRLREGLEVTDLGKKDEEK